MKLYLIIGGLIILALIGFGVSRVSFPDKVEVAPEPLSSTTPVSSVTINPLQSQVIIASTTESLFSQITKSQKINVGTIVKTNIGGRALIESSSQHKTLIDYNSEIKITDDSKEEKRTKIALVSGAVWSRLQKVFDSGEYYEVKTSNAVATVRGTSFGVWYSNHTTTIIVTEGSIFVSAVNETTGEIIPGTEVVVFAGYKAIITGNGKISISKLDSSDTGSAWYRYNNPSGKIILINQTTPDNLPPSPPDTIIPTTNPPTTTSTGFSITGITPSKVEARRDLYVTIKGEGFLQLKSVVIGKNSIQNYKILSPTSIQISAGDLNTGTYDVSLISLSNEIATSPVQLTVTAPVNPYSYQTPETFYPQ